MKTKSCDKLGTVMNHWIAMRDMADFFKKANMPSVAQCLMAGCAEIENIWQDCDLIRTNQGGDKSRESFMDR